MKLLIQMWNTRKHHLFHIIPVPSTIGSEHVVSFVCQYVKSTPLVLSAGSVCLLPPMSILVPTFSTDSTVATCCISARVSFFLAVLCFMSSNVVCGRDQLPFHSSLLVMVRVVTRVIRRICCGGPDYASCFF